jgi:hypothetical protein
MFRLLVVATVLAWLPASAQAQWGREPKTVLSGQPVKLVFANSTHANCSTIGRPTIRITQPPENGRVSITAANDFPSFSRANQRYDCNRRRVPGTLVRYVSNRGFTGSDSVGIEIFFVTGTYQSKSYTINVR